MEDFSIYNFTLDDYGYDYIDFHDGTSQFIQFVATCVIICIALPLTPAAVCALYRVVGNDHVAPIYVINLLISNLVRLCCLMVLMARRVIWFPTLGLDFIYPSSLVVSICFKVCLALERYLVIACPLWYSSRRNIKTAVLVCVSVWTLTLVPLLKLYVQGNILFEETLFRFFLLLPLLLFVFFLSGTLKALSASRVPSDEKRRIVGLLVVVLFIYTLLFLPLIIYLLKDEARYNYTLRSLSIMFLRLNPLADLTLYVFMKKGTIDRLLSCVCCCRMDSSDISSSPV